MKKIWNTVGVIAGLWCAASFSFTWWNGDVATVSVWIMAILGSLNVATSSLIGIFADEW